MFAYGLNMHAHDRITIEALPGSGSGHAACCLHEVKAIEQLSGGGGRDQSLVIVVQRWYSYPASCIAEDAECTLLKRKCFITEEGT
jgi:hypothetical protein